MFANARLRVALVAIALVGAAVVTLKSSSQSTHLRPGATVLSVQDDGVRTITYRTAARTLTARRTGDGFAVTAVDADGRRGHQCAVARDLGGLLPRLVEIEAKRELTLEQAASEFPVQIGTLVLEDEIASEPIPPFIVRATKDRRAVAMVYQDTAFEATIGPEVFAKLDAGCAALAGK